MSTPASHEERLRILRLLEEGQVSAEEAARLLDALNSPRAEAPRPAVMPVDEPPAAEEPAPEQPAGAPRRGPRWFKVRVTDTVSGRSKVSVTLPIGLMEWGLRVGGQFAPEIAGYRLEELGNLLKSESQGKLIDVVDEEDGEHVEIFID